jgi:hypothetical protein
MVEVQTEAIPPSLPKTGYPEHSDKPAFGRAYRQRTLIVSCGHFNEMAVTRPWDSARTSHEMLTDPVRFPGTKTTYKNNII